MFTLEFNPNPKYSLAWKISPKNSMIINEYEHPKQRQNLEDHWQLLDLHGKAMREKNGLDDS